MDFMSTRGGQEFISKVSVCLNGIDKSLKSIAKSLEIIVEKEEESSQKKEN